MIVLLKKHYLGVLLAVIVGLVSLIPNVAAIDSMGEQFSGVYPVNGSDDLYYFARQQEILDGHITLSNPYLFEHKDGTPAPFWIPDMILAKTGQVFGLGVGGTELLFDLVLPFMLTLLTYAILYLLSTNVLLSVSGAIFLHLGIFLESFNRSPSPQFNFLFFLLLIFFTLLFLQKGRFLYAIGGGLSFGMLFYVYTYYWTYAVVLFGIFLLALMLFKRDERVLIKRLLTTAVFVGVLALPYIFEAVQSLQDPFYRESLARLGMIETHFPSGVAIVLMSGSMLAFLLVLLWKNIVPKSPVLLFLISGTLASIIAVNQHVVTGKNLEFSSHYWEVSMFFVLFALVYGLNKLLVYYKHNTIPVQVLLFTVVIIFSTPHLIDAVEKQATVSESEYHWQLYAPVFEWLRGNASFGDVVYASDELSALIPIYTSQNVYYTSSANLHIISDAEVRDRFAIAHYWNPVDAEYLKTHERDIWRVQYVNRWAHQRSENRVRKLAGLSPRVEARLPEREITDMLGIYNNIRSMSFQEALLRYRVDYLVWDIDADSAWSPESEMFLSEAADFGRFRIYEVI